MLDWHATTILSVRRGPKVAIGGDGQVTLGTTVMKDNAVKVRKLLDGQVLVGFAGSAADGFALMERFETKLKDFPNNVPRAATELAKLWRTDRILRRLEAVLIVVDARHSLLLSGSGDVIQPTDGILSTGSGGGYALAAACEALAWPIAEPAGRRDRARVSQDRGRDRHLYEWKPDGGGAAVRDLTPREIVAELDRDIVGQADAKRAVAIALRNRWRRRQLPDEMRSQVTPKNILLIGPTGVGKTEIARRLAKLVGAPFMKVEATKYTEVGYYGRDVESLVRDLVEAAITLVRASEREKVTEQAGARVNQRLLDLLLPAPAGATTWNDDPEKPDEAAERRQRSREKMKKRLEAGALEDREIEVTMPGRSGAPISVLGAANLEQMEMEIQGMLEKMLPKSTMTRRMTVKDARPILLAQETEALIDQEKVNLAAVSLTEESGIVFLDELDKIAGDEGSSRGPDVSRQGVQRDLLPIVEGTTVNTKYGPVKTDHVLFIAAGAFHRSKPSDLMPELQGRFPIRVELQDLTRDDFARILREPRASLIRQYQALLATEGITLEFTVDAIESMADYAFQVNRSTQNIGARRLHTILERVVEDLSFDAPDRKEKHVVIDAAQIHQRLEALSKDEDLSRFIL